MKKKVSNLAVGDNVIGMGVVVRVDRSSTGETDITSYNAASGDLETSFPPFDLIVDVEVMPGREITTFFRILSGLASSLKCHMDRNPISNDSDECRLREARDLWRAHMGEKEFVPARFDIVPEHYGQVLAGVLDSLRYYMPSMAPRAQDFDDRRIRDAQNMLNALAAGREFQPFELTPVQAAANKMLDLLLEIEEWLSLGDIVGASGEILKAVRDLVDPLRPLPTIPAAPPVPVITPELLADSKARHQIKRDLAHLHAWTEDTVARINSLPKNA